MGEVEGDGSSNIKQHYFSKVKVRTNLSQEKWAMRTCCHQFCFEMHFRGVFKCEIIGNRNVKICEYKSQ